MFLLLEWNVAKMRLIDSLERQMLKAWKGKVQDLERPGKSLKPQPLDMKFGPSGPDAVYYVQAITQEIKLQSLLILPTHY